MDKIRLFHIGISEESKKIVQTFLDSHSTIRIIGSASSEADAIELIKRTYPDILLIDDNISPDSLATLIEVILFQNPFLGIIVTTTKFRIERVKKYINAGARGYLIKPYNAMELVNTIENVYWYIERLKNKLVKNSAKILKRAPQMITVFSTKGGVGKSTISTLLSAGLASIHREDTVVVDLDLQFGDISLLFDIKPKITISNIIEAIERLKSSDLRNLLEKHNLGVYFIPSPLNPEEQEFITVGALERMFSLLKEEFDYIIVDCPPGFTDYAITAIENSDMILFISSPEILSLKNTKTGIKTLQEIGVDLDKIKVIVNRYDAKNPISLALFEEVLRTPVYATISDDYKNIIKFFNQGQPQIIFESNGKVSHDFKNLIDKLRKYQTVTINKKQKKWLWPFAKNK